VISLRRAPPLAAAAFWLSGCMPEPATVQGRDVATLYNYFMVAAAFVGLLVAGLITWSVIRYRARGGKDELPPQTSGHIWLEVTWWALPTLLTLGLIVGTAIVLGRVDAAPPANSLKVEVTGFQWGWRFTYPDTGATIVGTAADPQRISLPVGRPITFILKSADVVHSFFVPHLLVKRDTVPGRVNELTVTFDQEGTYAGQCGEFCGLLHADMRFEIDAVSQEAFEAWLASQPAASQPAPSQPAASP
jgi:cytochrome c oxidase subunit 2